MTSSSSLLFQKHVKSWDLFLASLRTPLTPFTISVDRNGFLRNPLNSYVENNLHKTNDTLPSARGSGAESNKLSNLTCLTGGKYPVLDWAGWLMLEDEDEVSEFALRLAHTFETTRRAGPQCIAPIQLRLRDTSYARAKQISPVIAPYLDIDDCIMVDESEVLRHVDPQGYVQPSLKTLHLTNSQLAYKARICCRILAEELGLDQDEIFCSIMKTPIPGVDFVRQTNPIAKHRWGFAPLLEQGGKVKVKTSCWMVFGLKAFLECPVETFVDKQVFGLNETDRTNFSRMMRKDVSGLVESKNQDMKFARGYGIMLTQKKLGIFQRRVLSALQGDCRWAERLDKYENPWVIAGTTRCKATDIDIDAGAQGMRFPGASKGFSCCYHRLYEKISKISQRIVETVPHGKCKVYTSMKNGHDLCACTKKGLADPTSFTRTPIPPGVHLEDGRIEERDLWLLTARCNRVVAICDGHGRHIDWAMRLLEHRDYGHLFEATLTNLFVPGNLARFELHQPGCFNAPGVFSDDSTTTKYFPLEDYHFKVSTPSSPTLSSSTTTIKELIDVPWIPDPSKADASTPLKKRVVATKLLSEHIDDVMCQHVIKYVNNLLSQSPAFQILDLKTRKKKNFNPDEVSTAIFVSKVDNTNLLNGLVVCIGPPFYCSHYANDEKTQRDLLQAWLQRNPGVSIKEFSRCTDDEFLSANFHTVPPPSTKETPGSTKKKTNNKIAANNCVIRFDSTRNSFYLNASCSHPACIKTNNTKVYQTAPYKILNDDKILRTLFGFGGVSKTHNRDINNIEAHRNKKARHIVDPLEEFISNYESTHKSSAHPPNFRRTPSGRNMP